MHTGQATAAVASFKDVIEQHRAASEALRASFVDFETIKALQNYGADWDRQLKAASEALTPFKNFDFLGLTQLQKEMETWAKSLFQPFNEYFERDRIDRARFDRVLASGYVPHYTTPWQSLQEGQDEQVGPRVEEHYRNKWAEVSEVLQNRVQAYQVDDEAKSTYREALLTHSHGLYRSTVRVLFPEIERVVRTEFFSNEVRSLASLKEVRQAAGDLPAQEITDFDFGIQLLGLVDEKLYNRVETPELVMQARSDTIPNRHAALHGLAPYDNVKNSVNMLIMTDFMFHVISRIKRYAEPTR